MNNRQLILNNLSAQLATVATATGWGKAPIALGTLPSIAWRDTVSRAHEYIYGLAPLYSLRVAVGCYTIGAAAAREMMQQALSAATADGTHGGYALRTMERSGNLKQSTLGDTVACSVLVLDILYRSLATETVTAGNVLIDESGNVLVDESGDSLTW